MHAYAIPIISFPDGVIVATAELAARISDAARTALDRLVERSQGRGVPVDGLLREGVAWDEIARAGDDVEADIVVIGTHGRRGLTRALLGSVAENVIRTARRPVLTIRGPRDQSSQ
jgi:nucleotide-binding universal stress UspA family protein